MFQDAGLWLHIAALGVGLPPPVIESISLDDKKNQASNLPLCPSIALEVS